MPYQHDPAGWIPMAEGWQYGYILGQPTIKRGISTSVGVADIISLKCVNLLPDGNGNVQSNAKGDVFLFSDLSRGGNNFRYAQLCRALGLKIREYETTSGKIMEELPDPNLPAMKNSFIRFLVVHQEWEGRDGEKRVSAVVTNYEPWDGKDPEGKQLAPLEEPEGTTSADDDVPF